MGNESKLLTAEQLALKNGLCTCDEYYINRGINAPDCPFHGFMVDESMEEYKDLHTAPLQARIEELEREMKIIDHRSVALSDNLADQRRINTRLKAENEKLKNNEDLVLSNIDANNMIKERLSEVVETNERLREALEWYADSGNYLTDNERLATAWSKNRNIEKKAKEALKES